MPKVAVIDGKIYSSKLEYNAVDHCNLRCNECSHLSPYQRAGALAIETFERDLRRLASVYRVRRFRFVGGEPLLNRDLTSLVGIVRNSGIADEVEVATNGILLSRTSDDALSNFDRISVSLYPARQAASVNVGQLRKRLKRLGVELKVERVDRFRAMETPAPHDKHDTTRIFRSCLIAHTWRCQTFYDGRFYLCSRPIYQNSFLEMTGRHSEDLRVLDGEELHEPGLRDRLLKMLERDEPLESCRNCLGTAGSYAAWRQLSRDEVRQPRPGDHATIDERRVLFVGNYLKAQRKLTSILSNPTVERMSDALLTKIIGD